MAPNPVVLIVDENEDSRVIASSILTHIGYDAHALSDARAALIQAHTLQPDAFIIDLELRLLTGYDTLMLLRLDPRLEHVPALATSGYSLEADARARGFQGFLRKPFSVELFIRAMRRLLEPISA